MNLKKNGQGFTLVEILVVLVVIAILSASSIPSLVGWFYNAKNKIAIVECRSVVQATQTTALEQYGIGTYTLDNITTPNMTTTDTESNILTLAEASGTIMDLYCDPSNYMMIKLIYLATNGKYVYYNYEDGTYTVYDTYSDIQDFGNNITSYLATSTSLLSSAYDSTNAIYSTLDGAHQNVWDALNALYKEKYNGAYPSLSATEGNYLAKDSATKGTQFSSTYWESLTWKPRIIGSTIKGTYSSSSSEIVMMASIGESNQSPLIYYNGYYYYHTNKYGIKDSANVSDNGSFILHTNTNGTGLDINNTYWTKIVQ